MGRAIERSDHRMRYTHTMTVTVPDALVPVAKMLSKAFDEDSGGDLAFESTTYVSPITEHLAAAAPYLLLDPAALHASVAADYASRWPDLDPPTLDDVTQFCEQATIDVVPGLHF